MNTLLRTPTKTLLAQVTLDRRHKLPLHAQISEALGTLIETEFQPGDIFFPEKVLVDSLSVSRVTVRRALDELRLAGLLTRRRGHGSIVQSAQGPGSVGTAKENLYPPTGNAPGERGAAEIADPAWLRTVGILSPVTQSEYNMAFLERMGQACRERGFLFRVYYQESSSELPEIFHASTPGPEREGILLFAPCRWTMRLLLRLRDLGYRTVAVDGIPPGYPAPIVATDSAAAIRIGLEHLFAFGHRRITLLVNEPLYDSSVTTKVEAFQHHMHERGLGSLARLVVCATGAQNGSYAAAYAHMRDVWAPEAGTQPTAIMTVSDPGAWAALRWLAERGVAVPQQVSVLGFEDARSSQYMHPALSSVAHPIQDVVMRALDVLRDRSTPDDFVEWITPLLAARESTGPATTVLGGGSLFPPALRQPPSQSDTDDDPDDGVARPQPEDDSPPGHFS